MAGGSRPGTLFFNFNQRSVTRRIALEVQHVFLRSLRLDRPLTFRLSAIRVAGGYVPSGLSGVPFCDLCDLGVQPCKRRHQFMTGDKATVFY